MVEPATSLGRSGLQDWLVQRITAVILAFYTVFLLGYLVLHPELYYEQWRSLFASRLVQYGSLLALLSLLAHAWIGIWTVITDYIKPFLIRLIVQVVVILVLFFYLIWGMQIIWRI